MNIKSVLKNDRGYQIRGDFYGNGGNKPLCGEILQYETYGDGDTQHSGAWPAQWDSIVDVCLSVAAAIRADPLNEAWACLTSMLRRVDDETLRWALGVVYKPGKRQYYSVAVLKVTTADKSNDRRFDVVNEYMDGSTAGALRVVSGEYWNTLERLMVCDRLRDLHYELVGGYDSWANTFKWTTELPDGWECALAAFKYALQAVEYMRHSERTAEATLGNIRRREEVKAAATVEMVAA